MGYLHINNLYKDQTILIFKECYALEKIHGTSAHLSWSWKDKKIKYFSGGESYERFIKLFDYNFLVDKFSELFIDSNITIYGEAYGGKQQGMANTYGKELKFIAFDVLINDLWLEVPKAESICNNLNIEFVDYTKVSTDLKSLDAERDKPSTQAKRNGIVDSKVREGVVLRPLVELTMKNGERIIAKHKRDEFKETKTTREVNPEQLKILEDAKAIAEEWVTEMRLSHVLDKLPKNLSMKNTKLVIDSMIEDVYREAKGEIIESKEVIKCIGGKTVKLFKQKLQNLNGLNNKL
jgi:hypothetical protein